MSGSPGDPLAALAAFRAVLYECFGRRRDALFDLVGAAAGYTVYALNPKAVERYRARTRVAGAKSDPADAELLAQILVTDRERHRLLCPSSPQVAAIRALTRDDERASRHHWANLRVRPGRGFWRRPGSGRRPLQTALRWGRLVSPG